MHGQNRAEYKARFNDEKTSSLLKQKAKQWYALSEEILSRRRGPTESVVKIEETLKLTEKLLAVNPDPTHLWNHRRELLLQLYDTKAEHDLRSTGTSCKVANEFIDQERGLTSTSLQRNPKAYGAWFHRKWSIRHWLQLELNVVCDGETRIQNDDSRFGDICIEWEKKATEELELCSQFLILDERNFHCWNYRRFMVSVMAFILQTKESLDSKDKVNLDIKRFTSLLAKLDGSWLWANNCFDKEKENIVMGSQLSCDNSSHEADNLTMLGEEQREFLIKNEWNFTFEKIQQNFSNCSAFHYRSKLLPLMLNYQYRKLDMPSQTQLDELKLSLAQDELELVQNAIFTEPDDQTAWWYHRFVIFWSKPSYLDGTALEAYVELLDYEIESIKELINTEGGKCKWGFLAQHMLITEMKSTLSLLDLGEEYNNLNAEANQCLEKLILLDPVRKKRYSSMIQHE